jgi:hypothetical protein
MAIAQNIKQQEDLILQSAVFKSVKPVNIQQYLYFILHISLQTPSPALKPRSTVEFDYANISKVFEENSVCITIYQNQILFLRSYSHKCCYQYSFVR